jgi:hypothetical protein
LGIETARSVLEFVTGRRDGGRLEASAGWASMVGKDNVEVDPGVGKGWIRMKTGEESEDRM